MSFLSRSAIAASADSPANGKIGSGTSSHIIYLSNNFWYCLCGSDHATNRAKAKIVRTGSLDWDKITCAKCLKLKVNPLPKSEKELPPPSRDAQQADFYVNKISLQNEKLAEYRNKNDEANIKKTEELLTDMEKKLKTIQARL